MAAKDFPDPLQFDHDLVVRGNDVCHDDFVISFPIRAQALAFAWMLGMARMGYYIMAEPEAYSSTATGFALEMPPEDVVGPYKKPIESD